MVTHKKLSKLARAIAGVCRFEALERRQMLTTLSGGDVFDYKDSNNDLFRITLRGNVDAEFIGAAVDDTNAVTLGDIEPWDVADGQGKDLFAVYVRDADWNSSITIEAIDRDPQNGQVTHTPFRGNIDLSVANARDGRDLSIDTNGGTGQAYLGARTRQVGGVRDNEPITSANLSGQIGIFPRDSGPLSAGLQVTNGENLGKFFFDGTVTGTVDIGGSMNTFYAGNVLTGTTAGAFISTADSTTPNNFNVDGDLHNLIVSGSVGTDTDNGLDDPTYLTRFQMRVGGHLGQVDVGDDFVGTVQANHQTRYFVDQVQDEVESRGEGPSYVNGFLNDTDSNGDDQFHNDTFATAQLLGTVRDGIVVEGSLVAVDRANYRDWVDYYGVALVAGQTVTVQLTDTTGGPSRINLGVFDADGRLIATDYSDVDRNALKGKPFQFTADRPGIYRFAVGETGDGDFNGPAGLALPGHVGMRTYELEISGAGNLALGAVSAGGNVFDPEITRDGFVAAGGDVGAIVAGGTAIFQFKAAGNYSVRTDGGDLRVIEADSIGRLDNGAVVGGPELSITDGNVGLLRANNGPLGVNPGSFLSPAGAVPRNYQLVSASGRFQGALFADQKIGTLRAGDMATLLPSVFVVNADNTGGDGVIDLIDVKGDFGTLLGGGPHITTGPKGNVRYINVEGNLFRDEAFGGGRPDLTLFNPGQTATLTDDSGAVLRATPGSSGTLGVLTYGIRGSGGSAIVRIETTGSVNINASVRSSGAPAEIGMILSTGDGPNLIPTTNGRVGFDPAAPNVPVNVFVNGKSRVDVLNVRGGRFTRIDNNTVGEIVNILAESVGTLEAENLGIAKHSTPAAVLPYDVLVLGDVYPFSGQRTGIVLGDVMYAKSSGRIGNLIVNPAMAETIAERIDPLVANLMDLGDNNGVINSVTADSNGKRTDSSIFEGIVAPIYASGGIVDTTIGAGILPSGNGNLAHAGLFSDGRIGIVRGRKAASIRGNIVSETAITKIDLYNGGSIINANIMVTADLEDSREFVPSATYPADIDSVDTPTYEIGAINLTGDGKSERLTRGRPEQATARNEEATKAAKKKKKKKQAAPAPRPRTALSTPRPAASRPARAPKVINRGGIIGSFISAPDIGATIVKGGNFGILNSVFSVPGNGVISKIHGEGYGLRDLQIYSGARIGDIIAAGNGSATTTSQFTADVRLSESESIDPYFGFAPNGLSDLHKFLGTSKNEPIITGVTESGVISGVSAVASRDLKSLVAWKLVGSRNAASPTVFNFANQIKKIQIGQDMSDVSIITGAIDLFKVGRDVIDLDMTVAGTIKSISIGGTYDDQSRIRAIGPDGSIDNIFVNRDLDGVITAENEVGRLRVNGLYNGDVLANGVRVQDS